MRRVNSIPVSSEVCEPNQQPAILRRGQTACGEALYEAEDGRIIARTIMFLAAPLRQHAAGRSGARTSFPAASSCAAGHYEHCPSDSSEYRRAIEARLSCYCDARSEHLNLNGVMVMVLPDSDQLSRRPIPLAVAVGDFKGDGRSSDLVLVNQGKR